MIWIKRDPFAANICRTWAQHGEICGRLPTAGLWWSMERIFSDGGTLDCYEVEWLKQCIQWRKCQGYDALAMAQARSDHERVASLQQLINDVDYVYSEITNAREVDEFDEDE